ncbi:MAG: hypothetical protein SWH61_16740 [Thermodesulfobacteriota bacterium]|nr:hypothetical protein [Thermodesulfobacteriota bacterium]
MFCQIKQIRSIAAKSAAESRLIWVLVLLVCFVVPAGAENNPADIPAASSGVDAKDKQQVRQALEKMQALQEQLRTIQQDVVAANPELKKDQEAFRALIKKTFDDKLAAANVDLQQMKAIQMKLKQDQEKSDLSAEEREALTQTFKTQVMGFQKARHEAMTDKTVLQKREALAADMKAAMIKADPRTKGIIKELEDLQAGLPQKK